MKLKFKSVMFFAFFCLFSLTFTSCGSTGIVYAKEVEEDTVAEGETSGTDDGSEDEADYKETVSSCIYVYVCGAVRASGVYELPSDARIYQAIDAAGGMTDDAAEDAVNLAGTLEDGMQIRVPTIWEQQETDSQAQSGVDSEGRINLNTASEEQLITLPGIGESRALSIIAYREEHGDFSSIEDVMNVSGIKEGAYNKIKDLICVN